MQSPTGSEQDDALAAVVGRRVASADSSLSCFAVALDDGRGLLAEAREGEAPAVAVSTRPASELPSLGDAVCAVDWSWIVGATIRRATLASGALWLELDPVGPLTVSAALWQGAPFLAFQPYRAPADPSSRRR